MTKYWTIAFPGECGQHVQETWSEEQILASAWYKNWVMMVVQANKAHLLEDPSIAIDDWITVHWAMPTDEFGKVNQKV
jgi:hypothetical protein